MIKKSDLKQVTRRVDSGDMVIDTTIPLNNRMVVAYEVLGSAKYDAVEMAKEEALSGIMQKIYGDLLHPLLELRARVLSLIPSQHSREAYERFENLRHLIVGEEE